MATNTPNINLVKPAYTDNADIGVINANADKIDTAVKALQDLITALQTATTPLAILNAIKTVDGAGSGLDADLLDGKNSTEFFIKNPTLTSVKDLNNPFGIALAPNTVSDLPESVYSIVETKFLNNVSRLVEVSQIYNEQKKFYAIYESAVGWSAWKEIKGGGNLFTYPKTFNVINAQSGQTVFSYSGGSGRVITTHMANTSPEITIDGTVVSYSNYPYSGTGATGTSQVINLEFKNSVVIKTVQAASGNVTGLIQTEKA